MKTKFSMFAIAVIATGAIFITGCNGDDLSTPTIVLEGDDPMEVVLGGTYTDPGFTATDDEDGDVTADVIIDDSDVDTDEIDEYEVTYSVTDKAGNVGTTTRTVRVVMDKPHYTGTYQVHEECDIDGNGIKGEPGESFDYTVTVTSGGDANELLFENFGAYGTTVIVPVFFSGDLNDDLEVDNYNLPGSTIYFDGTGSITIGTTSNIEFEFNYSAQDGAVIVPCDAVFEKL
ncbi:MAG: immunoglobulin-like domain-containing protein [Chitinophagales bacterium]